MVDTRVVVVVSAFLLLLAIGFGWLGVDSDQFEAGYSLLGVYNQIGSAYGLCGCPPSSTTIDGQFWQIMLPLLVAPGLLAASLVAFPIGFFLSLWSIFRWRLTIVAGVFTISSGLLWIEGISTVHNQVVRGLSDWPGYAGHSVSSGMWVQVGPYDTIAGGLLLVVGYVLSNREILNTPTD